MLEAIPARYQKTAGFPAYDFTRAFALAVLSLDGDVEAAEAHLNIYSLEGLDLDTYITQHRGLVRRYGAHAAAVLRVVSGGGAVEAGDVFATDAGVEFVAVSDGTYSQGDTFPVTAAEAGTAGNVAAGTITRLPVTISGIAAVTNPAAASGGTNGEDDDTFRERFLEGLRNPSNGANAGAYLAWARSVEGVGRARVFPLAGGAGTVTVCVTGADMGVPAAGVVQAVQDCIDPHRNGDGAGQAPIGAVCTAAACRARTIDVAVTLTLEEGVSDAEDAVRAALTAYFRSVAFVGSLVSYAQAGNAILDAEGVADYSGLTLNGAAGSVSLETDQVPVLGTLTIA